MHARTCILVIPGCVTRQLLPFDFQSANHLRTEYEFWLFENLLTSGKVCFKPCRMGDSDLENNEVL